MVIFIKAVMGLAALALLVGTVYGIDALTVKETVVCEWEENVGLHYEPPYTTISYIDKTPVTNFHPAKHGILVRCGEIEFTQMVNKSWYDQYPDIPAPTVVHSQGKIFDHGHEAQW